MDPSRFWNDLIEKYSRCELTYPSNRLVAVAGIAKLFQDVTKDRYIAGPWSSHLLPMMTWRVHYPQPRRPSEYRASLWSWAFVDGPVHMTGFSSDSKLLVSFWMLKSLPDYRMKCP